MKFPDTFAGRGLLAGVYTAKFPSVYLNEFTHNERVKKFNYWATFPICAVVGGAVGFSGGLVLDIISIPFVLFVKL